MPVLLLLGAGCLQIETNIQLEEDGSATITERVQLSAMLLELNSGAGPGQDIAAALGRDAVAARLKQMGPGIELVKHEVRDAEKGARESVAVFKIPQLGDFVYVSPYMAALNYPKHAALKATLFPIYESTWDGRRAGNMGVTFAPASAERPSGKPAAAQGPAPAELQVLRDLRPILADVMADFQVKVTFESYAPLGSRPYYRFRGDGARTRRFDLIDFSGSDMDKYGNAFLSNEEVMLELLGGRLGGPNIVDNAAGHPSNMTVPVYHPGGTPEFYFRPSRALFDRHFAGKTLKFDARQGGERPAKWEEVGYKPDAKEAGGKEESAP